jgi:dTMP kinase
VTRSLFVTLDGIDGVGKSTQIERLVEYLSDDGHEVLAVRDPGTTAVGAKLRELLLDSQLVMHRRTEAMLFMASRCEMIESVIRPALAKGKTVISDRFLLSTVVYQSIGGNVPTDQLWRMGRLANNRLEPDLTILLDMPARAAIERMDGSPDRMEKRGVEYMESVRQAFLQQLTHSSPATAVVDASDSAGEVAAAIRSAVQEL